MVIDVHEARRRWVVSLLAFASYHVYAARTPFEAYAWYMEHHTAPQVLLLGQLNQEEQLFVQRLWQLMVMQQNKSFPVLSLEVYFPIAAARKTLAFSPSARGCFGLLEVLWRAVARRL